MSDVLTEEQKKAAYQKGQKILVDWLKSCNEGTLKNIQTLCKLYVARGDCTSETAVLTELQDGNGRVGIHFAASQGHTTVCEWMLSICPDLINLSDDQNNTPLCLACTNNRKDTIISLIEHGANINQDLHGKTPLHCACSGCDLTTFKYIIEHGGNIKNHPTGEQADYVHFSVSNNNIEVTRYLLEQGESPNFVDDSKVSPLILAAVHTNPEMIQLLLEYGADATHCLDNNVSPLHIVCETGHFPSVKPFLIQSNIAVLANIATLDKNHKPLHYAAANKSKDIVEALMPFTTGLNGHTSEQLMEECTFDEEPKTESAQPVAEVEVPKEIKVKAENYKNAGNLAFKNKNYDEAINQYTKAIETNSHNHIYFSNRSAAYLAIKKFNEALEDAQKCKELQPTWAKGYYREGEVYMALEKYTEAAETFWDGCNHDPSNKDLSEAFQNAITLGRAQYVAQHPKTDTEANETDEANEEKKE